jgi:protein-tyrosine-phosphatase
MGENVKQNGRGGARKNPANGTKKPVKGGVNAGCACVLFICVGNICRSPMAEVIFNNLARRRGSSLTAQSAGTCACVGMDMSPLAKEALVACGEMLPKSRHASRQYTTEMGERAIQIVDLRTFDDPYGRDLETYIGVCKKLQQEIANLFDKLCAGGVK